MTMSAGTVMVGAMQGSDYQAQPAWRCRTAMCACEKAMMQPAGSALLHATTTAPDGAAFRDSATFQAHVWGHMHAYVRRRRLRGQNCIRRHLPSPPSFPAPRPGPPCSPSCCSRSLRAASCGWSAVPPLDPGGDDAENDSGAAGGCDGPARPAGGVGLRAPLELGTRSGPAGLTRPPLELGTRSRYSERLLVLVLLLAEAVR